MIDGVAHFLRGEFLARDVDPLKPLDLLLVIAAAEIDRQLVVEELLLTRILRPVEPTEVPLLVGEVVVEILADGNRALLPVHDLVPAVVAHDPVHRVQRKAVHDRINDKQPVLLVVNELALIGRTDVQLAVVAVNALVALVAVTRDQVAHLDLMKRDFHLSSL